MSMSRRFLRWLGLSGTESVTEPTVPVSVMERLLIQQRETILMVVEQMNPRTPMVQSQKLWVSEDDEDVAAIEEQYDSLIDEDKATIALNQFLEQMGLEGNVETYEG